MNNLGNGGNTEPSARAGFTRRTAAVSRSRYAACCSGSSGSKNGLSPLRLTIQRSRSGLPPAADSRGFATQRLCCIRAAAARSTTLHRRSVFVPPLPLPARAPMGRRQLPRARQSKIALVAAADEQRQSCRASCRGPVARQQEIVPPAPRSNCLGHSQGQSRFAPQSQAEPPLDRGQAGSAHPRK